MGFYQHFVIIYKEEKSEKEYIYIYIIAESLCYTSETNTTL